MDIETFEKYLMIYGSDFSRWPNELQKQAVKALEDEAILKRYEAQQDIDGVIQSWSIKAPAENIKQCRLQLHQRIAKVNKPLLTTLRPIPPKLAALTFAMVLGIALGLSLDLQENNDIYFDQIAFDEADFEEDA